MSIQNHIGYAQAVCCRSLVDVESFVANSIVFVFTYKRHCVSIYSDVAFASATVFNVAKTVTVSEDLDRIFF